jgi:hypothetical protein
LSLKHRGTENTERENLGKTLKVFEPIASAIEKLQIIANATFEEKSFGFGFNSLKNTRVENFSSQAPNWRIVIPGLNLYGKCDTPTCKAYKNVIWTQKGMGTFNIGKETKTSKCPMCNAKAVNITNLGFTDCQYTIEGEQETGLKVVEEKTAGGGHLTTFVNGDDVHWSYLDVTTKPKNKQLGCQIN